MMKRFPFRRATVYTVGLCALISPSAGRVSAATYTWAGSGTAWNSSADWQGGVAPPDDGTADLVFAGVGSQTPNVSPAYSIDSLTFNAGAQSYVFSGSAVTLGAGGLTQNAANTENFGVNLILGAAQTWTLASGAGVVKLSSGLNTNGQALTVNAATTAGSGNTLAGAITGGGSLTKTGAGTLTLTNASGSTFSGGTFITAGVVAIDNGAALGTGEIDLTGGELRATASVTVANNYAVLNFAAGTFSAAAGTTLTLSGSIGIQGDFNFGSTGQTGTVALTGNGGAGATSNAVNVNAGTLRVAGVSGADLLTVTNVVTVAAGATLDASGTTRYIDIGDLEGAGAVIIGNTVPQAFEVDAGSFSGVISGPGTLTVDGFHTQLTLSGTNTYTGGTNVLGGTLVESNNGNALSTGTVAVAKGATVALSNTSTTATIYQAGASTFSGEGTLQKLGAGVVALGGNGGSVNVSLGAGGSIDVEAGELLGSSNFGGIYTNNLGGLNIASGAIFDGAEAAVRVDALTGGGTLQGGYSTLGSVTLGVANGGGTFTGVIRDSGVAGGKLTLVKTGSGTQTLGGADTFTGSTTLAAGALGAGNDQALGTGALAVTGNATLFSAGADHTLANAVSLASGTTLTVANDPSGAHGLTLNGVLSGAGGLVKNGNGTLTLGNAANTFTGGLTLNGGTLAVAGDGSLGVAAANPVTLNAGILQFNASTATTRTFNLNGAVILGAAAGTTLTFGSGATVNGGGLRAGGTYAFADGSALNGTTALIGSASTQSTGTAAWDNVTVRGGFTQTGGTLNTTDGLTVATSGTLSIGGTVNLVNGAELDGIATINNGGKLATGTGNLYLGGGSRSTINAGGALSAAGGTTVELNGALLVNNGAQTGTLNVNYGSTAKGTGSFGTVNVGDGGRFGANASTSSGSVTSGLSTFRLTGADNLTRTAFVGPQLMVMPGTANVTSLTLGSGSVFAFNVQDAQGVVGSGYDLAHAGGMLTLSAGTTAGNLITISVASLDNSGTSGQAANFDPAESYRFVLVQADGGISGYNPAEFMVDASGFKNATNGGSFSVVQQGNNLDLIYTSAVPEPSAWTLLGVAAGGLGLVALRRQRGPVRR